MNVFYELISDSIEAGISAIIALLLRVALLLLGATIGLGFFIIIYAAPTVDTALLIDFKLFLFAVGLGYLLGSFRIQTSYMGIYAHTARGFTISTSALIATAYLLFGNSNKEIITYCATFTCVAIVSYIIHNTDKNGDWL